MSCKLKEILKKITWCINEDRLEIHTNKIDCDNSKVDWNAKNIKINEFVLKLKEKKNSYVTLEDAMKPTHFLNTGK